MSNEICETVTVKADNDDGYMVINKSDMTKDHVEYKAPAKKKAKKQDAETKE